MTTDKWLQIISNRILELIIMPTEQCNFRCVYCYEDFSIGKMKTHTVEAIKILLAKRVDSLDVLKISWFGGEPLVAKDIVYDVSKYIQELIKPYPRLYYAAGITTNGFGLKAATFQQLVNLGIKHFQVSLDGAQYFHDQVRKKMNGEGTFEKIWRNLLNAKQTDLDFSMMLRIHVHPQNVVDIYKLLDMIKIEFNADPRFSIFFKAIENLGGPNDGSFSVLDHQDSIRILLQLKRYLDGKVAVSNDLSCGSYVCYAAKTNSYVIRANGEIGKCTVALNDERNKIGYLLDDGTMELRENKFQLWTRGVKTQESQDLSCPLSGLPHC